MAVKKILKLKDHEYFWEKGDLHTHLGFVREKDIKKAKSSVKTHKGEKLTVHEPNAVDLTRAMERGPQMPFIKDVAIIAFYSGISKDSRVLDAGSGSGLMAISMARIAKSVVSYERDKRFYGLAKKNASLFGLKNVTFVEKDVYKGISEKELDLVVLDLPEPWKALKHAEKAMKSGGTLCAYLPNISQTEKLIKESKKFDFGFAKTIEVIEREWVVDEQRLRPSHHMYGHTAFLTFMRRL
ncbi:MAG: methyltransferase domain-containing protein [Candidatus Nanoarchaeia archaeon]|nr:methyltransferase domain-containing protein [Candidatus Nanoarchaeia archaeon]